MKKIVLTVMITGLLLFGCGATDVKIPLSDVHESGDEQQYDKNEKTADKAAVTLDETDATKALPTEDETADNAADAVETAEKVPVSDDTVLEAAEEALEKVPERIQKETSEEALEKVPERIQKETSEETLEKMPATATEIATNIFMIDKWEKDSVEIKAEAGPESQMIGEFVFGEELEVDIASMTCTAGGNGVIFWVKAVSQGEDGMVKKGWVNMDELIHVLPAYFVVDPSTGNEEVNVRALPDVNSELVGVFKAGDWAITPDLRTVTMGPGSDGADHEWVYASQDRTDGTHTEGWVRMDLIMKAKAGDDPLSGSVE